MKNVLVLLFLLSSSLISFTQNSINENMHLEPCPNSPNCVSTQATKKSKLMKPLLFSDQASVATLRLEKLLENQPEAKLVKNEGNYLHYEFTTKIGKFIDDVEFLIKEETGEIHFRSASRKGYGDFGKNKRRMKKIQNEWTKLALPS